MYMETPFLQTWISSPNAKWFKKEMGRSRKTWTDSLKIMIKEMSEALERIILGAIAAI